MQRNKHHALLASVTRVIVVLLISGCTLTNTHSPVIRVKQSTIVSFAPSVLDEERQIDDATAADDFEVSWAHFIAWTESAHLTVQRVNSPQFTIRTQKRDIRVTERSFGYVFVDSNGHYIVLRGVMTDADLQYAACEFFTRKASLSGCN